MFWEIFGIIMVLVLVGVTVYIRVKDRRYENKSVTETMSGRVWDEISEEREAAMARAKKFKQALESAKRK